MHSSKRWCNIPQILACLVTLSISTTFIATTANAQQSTNHRSLLTRRIDDGPMSSAAWSAKRLHSVQSNLRTRSGRPANDDDVRYKAVSVGVLPGKTNTYLDEEPSVLNNLGHVAGFSYVFTGDIHDFFLTAQAFIWKDGKLESLPLLKGWPGIFSTGINDRDQVIGEANNYDSLGRRRRTAVTWDRGKVIDLGRLDSDSDSAAFGINNWGVAVGFNYSYITGVTTPVVWYGGAIHPLPLLAGEAGGIAFGINDLGVIAGYQLTAGDASEAACLWYWTGSGYTAVPLGGLGGDYSEAFDVNIRGQAAGFSLFPGDLHGPAVLWDRRGPNALPLLPGDTDGIALAIDGRGQIVGFSDQIDNFGNVLSQRVVIWQHGTVTDLQTVVPADTPTLTDVGNANLKGQIAVDTGFFDDGTLAGYVLVPKDN